MRIDYSEPKKSCSSPQAGQYRPRKESNGGALVAIAFTALISLGIGFASGWMLSQRSAKEGFKAAMAQQSLENSPQQALPQEQQKIVTAPEPQSQGGVSAVQAVPAAGTETAPNPTLSFYKTLPGGQKNNIMGSGINSNDGTTEKQPLQAAMPGNISRPSPPHGGENIQKQPAQATTAKPASKPDSAGLTVQVASYSLKSEAEAQRSKLAAKGYNVSIVESNLKEKGIWYRVRVGKHLDPEAAKELASKLGKGAITIPDRN
ncbi:MAG: SPOR domain-containing protein [Desulfuromonadaceae bacterium]